jgi:hypothetical protein
MLIRSLLPLRLANGFANRSRDGLGEDVADTGGMLAQHMGVDAQGRHWVGMAKLRCHDKRRNPGKKQRGRVQVAQIVLPDMGSEVAGGGADLLYQLISLAISALTVSG